MSRKNLKLFERDCPDCCANAERLKGVKQQWACGCGLTVAEHKRMRGLRAQAEQKAHQLMVEARERDLLPRAIIKMAYDEAERQTKRTDRGHGG